MNEISAELEVVQPSALEALTRGEIDVQISTAHKFPRSLAQFQSRAIAMVSMDEETAESCIYRRPVGKEGGTMKYAEGLSVRMAEIVAACYGNIRYGSQIVTQTPEQVIARGFAHDLETNTASTSECVESTLKRDKTPMDERMRVVIAKAALAKAGRDALFKVVPKALCKRIEAEARRIIAGDSKPLSVRIASVEAWVKKLPFEASRVWTALGVAGPAELTDEHLVTLTGLRTALKDNEITLDEAFPMVIATGKVGSPLSKAIAEQAEKKADKPPVVEEKSAKPTASEMQAILRKKLAKLPGNHTELDLVGALMGLKMLANATKFELIDVDTLIAADERWEEIEEILK